MNHTVSGLLSIALLGIGAACCAAREAFPGTVTTKDLRGILGSVRRERHVPALSAVVMWNGRTVAAADGMRRLGGKTPVTVNDQFHIGSCTKAMTATLIGMLVEEGKLSWKTTLADVFPEFRDEMRPEYRTVTLTQLLTHRAGLPEESFPRGIGYWRERTDTPRRQREDYVRLALAEPPASTPGSAFLYSNRGYVIAGAVLERVANASWEDLIQRRLFRPLKMTTAGFGAMGTTGREDQPWQHAVTGGNAWPIPPSPISDNPPVLGPAGRVHCSMPDYARFVAMHLRGAQGKAALLKVATFRTLQTARPGEDYAMGWGVTERPWGGGTVLTHAGSNTMSYTVVWMAPKRDFAVVVSTNQGGDAAASACDDVASAVIRRLQQDGVS